MRKGLNDCALLEELGDIFSGENQFEDAQVCYEGITRNDESNGEIEQKIGGIYFNDKNPHMD